MNGPLGAGRHGDPLAGAPSYHPAVTDFDFHHAELGQQYRQFYPVRCLNSRASVAAAMQYGHDRLLEITGGARRSGVEWDILHGKAEAMAFLEEAAEQITTHGGGSLAIAAELDQVRAFFEQNPLRGRLVIACCWVERLT